MDVERVKVKTTVKCGEKIYLAGMVYKEPVPTDLIDEVRHNTGTVEVVAVPPSPPVVEDKTEDAKTETASKVEKPIKKEKPNPKETAKKKPGRPKKKTNDDDEVI
jgi:hypothetical protein